MKRNFKRNFMNNSGGRGPPLDAPDSLQDLDRELELLRRKRQLLEKQQYPNDYSRPNPWEQPPTSNDYNGSGRSFTQPQYVDLYDSSRRQTQTTSWQEPEPKRFRQQEFDSRPAPRTFQGQRSQQYAPPRSYNPPANYAPKRTKGFVNPKPGFANPKSSFSNSKPAYANKPSPAKPKPGPAAVAKQAFDNAKPSFANQKTGSANQRPAANNSAASATGRPVVKDVPKSGSKSLDYVLTDSNERSYPPAVRGRLEIALGALFRTFKERPNAELATELYKFVKHVYRQRIRKAMLGKKVGTPRSITSQYAEVYPDNDYEEVIRLAKEAQVKEATDKSLLDASEVDTNPYLKNIVVTADSPEVYYIQNIAIIVANKMDEVCARLEKACEGEPVSLRELVQEVDKISAEEVLEKMEETADADVASVATQENATENSENGSKSASGTPADDSSKALVEEKASTETSAPAEAETDSGEADMESKPATREEYYTKLMNLLIERELPRVLPTYKDYLASMLNADMMFYRAQKFIVQKAVAIARSKKKPECFVMILGDPTIPRKEQLQVFLDKFNPACIKRHKRVRNVLYVGFTDRQDFDRIIAEDGIHMAEMKLHIKESKNFCDDQFKVVKGCAKLITPKAQDDVTVAIATDEDIDKETGNDTAEQTAEETALDTTVESNNETAEDGKSLLDSDIDGQINDLLATINDDSVDAVQDEATEENSLAEDTDLPESNDVNETAEGAAEEAANGVETEKAPESSDVAKTPARASTRLAGGIQTRRASRLAQ